MALLALEVSRVLSDRSLEICFANAFSTVSSFVGEGSVMEAALQTQLMAYAGIEELESVSGSLKRADVDTACRAALKLRTTGSCYSLLRQYHYCGILHKNLWEGNFQLQWTSSLSVKHATPSTQNR